MHTVVETPEYLRRAKKLRISDEEIAYIRLFLALNPSAGNIVRGTGGARKVRIPTESTGKSGGYRVITFYSGPDYPVFLLNVYSKGSKGDLNEAEKNALKISLSKLLKDYKE